MLCHLALLYIPNPVLYFTHDGIAIATLGPWSDIDEHQSKSP